jgi:hypothetical protein
MSAKRKKTGKRGRPSIPPRTALRARLDAAFAREGWAAQDDHTIWAELDALLAGHGLDDSLPVLLRAHDHAPEAARRRLDDVVPPWLASRGHTHALLELLARGGIADDLCGTVEAWLVSAGVDRSAVAELLEQPFFRTYLYDDGSQGVVHVYWYTDHRRRHVKGLIVLIDHNPPWEGAVKDVFVTPAKDPEEAIAKYVDLPVTRGVLVHPVAPAEAKATILRGLDVNRREGIRLPRDLVRARQTFLEHVLPLPDDPADQQVPAFDAEAFDALARVGMSAEELRLFEHLIGRRVRRPDGGEMLILGADDMEDWDE